MSWAMMGTSSSRSLTKYEVALMILTSREDGRGSLRQKRVETNSEY